MPEQISRWRSFRPLYVTAFLLLATMGAAQGIADIRYRIAEADVAKELRVLGLNVSASQVHLPTYISSTTEAPKLEIFAARTIGTNQVRLELNCPTSSECLPFFATVDVEEPDSFSAEVRLKLRRAIGPNRQPTLPSKEARLTVGSHAVLVIRDGHVDIHLQVLAIDSGAIGQQVRVCTLDRKKVFRATVTGEGTVMGMTE